MNPKKQNLIQSQDKNTNIYYSLNKTRGQQIIAVGRAYLREQVNKEGAKFSPTNSQQPYDSVSNSAAIHCKRPLPQSKNRKITHEHNDKLTN